MEVTIDFGVAIESIPIDMLGKIRSGTLSGKRRRWPRASARWLTRFLSSRTRSSRQRRAGGSGNRFVAYHSYSSGAENGVKAFPVAQVSLRTLRGVQMGPETGVDLFEPLIFPYVCLHPHTTLLENLLRPSLIYY